MTELLGISVAVGIAVILNFAVKPFIKYTTSGLVPRPPSGIDDKTWEDIVDRRRAGGWIGFLELLLFLACFLNQAYLLLAGWLAFKVATKWEAWANIVRVPEELPKVKGIDFLRARSQLGSYILSRFMIGTLLNILVAVVASYIGMRIL
jgi:hypothetical protein